MSRHKLLKFHVLFHYVCYYAAWVLAVTCAVSDKGWLGTGIVLAITSLQIGWQYLVQERTRGLYHMVFIFTLAGFIIDSAFLRSGLIFFYDNPWQPYFSPSWMISLWISFAVIYYAVMERFWGRYWLNGIFAFFAFPFAYYASIKLGAGLLPHGDLSVMFYGVVWVPLLPLCDYMFQRSLAT